MFWREVRMTLEFLCPCLDISEPSLIRDWASMDWTRHLTNAWSDWDLREVEARSTPEVFVTFRGQGKMWQGSLPSGSAGAMREGFLVCNGVWVSNDIHTRTESFSWGTSDFNDIHFISQWFYCYGCSVYIVAFFMVLHSSIIQVSPTVLSVPPAFHHSMQHLLDLMG